MTGLNFDWETSKLENGETMHACVLSHGGDEFSMVVFETPAKPGTGELIPFMDGMYVVDTGWPRRSSAFVFVAVEGRETDVRDIYTVEDVQVSGMKMRERVEKKVRDCIMRNVWPS